MDPPWSYTDKAAAGKRGADFKYSTMSILELRALRVREIVDENAALFLWCTGPFLAHGISLIRSYGFEYKNIVFTWIKTNKKAGTIFMGMGNYTRANAEYVLLGIKGKMKRQSASVRSVVMSPMLGHSFKPPEIRKRIVKLFGDVSKIEFFARDLDESWVQTGLEFDGERIDSFIRKISDIKTAKDLVCLKSK